MRPDWTVSFTVLLREYIVMWTSRMISCSHPGISADPDKTLSVLQFSSTVRLFWSPLWVSLHLLLQGEPREDDLLPPVGQEGAIPQLWRWGSATQKWHRWEDLLEWLMVYQRTRQKLYRERIIFIVNLVLMSEELDVRWFNKKKAILK